MPRTTTPDAVEAAHDKAPALGRLTMLWAMTVAALAVHNVEEWLLDMTGWIAGHPWLPGGSLHGDPDQFALGLVIVTAVVFVLASVALVVKPAWSAEVLVCVAYALMINTASHAVLSMASWSLMPGAITGALVLLPVSVVTARSLPPVRWTASAVVKTVIAALGIVYGSLALAAVLTPIL
ncbi:MAG TPA: HXXEE domain-containing protein [Jiangellaceae bacterium]|nr:HXXEE domain-containing protein [Jiangellaceae bacterium]